MAVLEVVQELRKDEGVNPASGGNYAVKFAKKNGHQAVVQNFSMIQE